MEGPFNDREYMLLRSAIAREQEACSTVEEEGELTAILKDIEDKIYYMQHPDEKVAVCAIQGFATDCSLAIAEEIVNIQKNSEIAENARKPIELDESGAPFPVARGIALSSGITPRS